MTRSLTLVVLAVASQACVTVQDVEDVVLPAAGITLVTADIEHGDLVLDGTRGARSFDIETRIWGRGSTQEKADARQDDVTWSADVVGDRLVLKSDTVFTRAGVDMDVEGPDLFDTSLNVDRGTVRINDIEGVHVISATSVRGDLIGDVDIVASSSVDVDFIPWTRTNAIIEVTGGSVELGLPYGLDYDLTVRGDPDEEMTIANLGFRREDFGEGFFSGISGRGDVEIDVIVSGGSVEIRELR